MAFERKDREEYTLLRVQGDLTIFEAAGIHAAMLEILDERGSLVLDLKEVATCDAAGVQLLCAARKTASEEPSLFQVSEVSNAVLDALDRSGVDPRDALGADWEPCED